MQLSNKQKIQESRYDFPYHYIPTFENGNFSQTKTLNWGYEYLSYIHFVLDLLKKIEFNSLLDVGCGDGRFLSEVQNFCPEKRLVGIDYSKKAIEFAKIMSPSANYVHGNITTKAIFNDEFDVIILLETLEHIPPGEIDKFLGGIYRYLKDSGRLIITVPSRNIPVHAKHYMHFDLESLKSVFGEHFDISECYFLNKMGFRANIIQNILKERAFLINSRKILNFIYKYYIGNLLIGNKNDTKRICIIARRLPK